MDIFLSTRRMQWKCKHKRESRVGSPGQFRIDPDPSRNAIPYSFNLFLMMSPNHPTRRMSQMIIAMMSGMKTKKTITNVTKILLKTVMKPCRTMWKVC